MTIFVQNLDIAGRNGERGPTVAIKDTIDVAGFPTRAGSRALADAPPAGEHAEVVVRLLDAGWRIVGKTTMHELAFGTTGINHWAGTPTNPLFPAFVPGGSSSGSAAAVAAGLADAALGTDTGGSVRIPAACCGVFGLKPSFGRVSRRGVLPGRTTLDCVGPFAATMERLVACMAAIDPSFGPLPDPSGLTIGLVAVEADPRFAAAARRAVEACGLPLRDVHLPGLAAAYDAGLSVINVETWAACGSLVAGGPANSLVGPDVAQRLLAASRTTADALETAEAVRVSFTAEVDALLETTPILAMPTMAGPPPLVADAADTSRLVGMTSLVRPFNLSGHPAIAIPLPAVDGAPASLQLVAAKGADERLCAVAGLFAAPAVP